MGISLFWLKKVVLSVKSEYGVSMAGQNIYNI